MRIIIFDLKGWLKIPLDLNDINIYKKIIERYGDDSIFIIPLIQLFISNPSIDSITIKTKLGNEYMITYE